MGLGFLGMRLSLRRKIIRLKFVKIVVLIDVMYLKVMYLKDTLDVLGLFQKLLSEVVELYRISKGFKTDDLYFRLVRGKEFWLDDRMSDESKTVIKISSWSDSYNVNVIDDGYSDLGDKIREKLVELGKKVN